MQAGLRLCLVIGVHSRPINSDSSVIITHPTTLDHPHPYFYQPRGPFTLRDCPSRTLVTVVTVADDPRKYARVFRELRQRIADGTYPAGAPLPPLAALADEFDVARDTAQRAVRMLADEGLVERWAGLGWYVK